MYGKTNLDAFKFHFKEKESESNKGTIFNKISFSVASIKDFIEKFEPKNDSKKKIVLRLPPKAADHKAVEYISLKQGVISGYFYVGFYGIGASQSQIDMALDDDLKDTKESDELAVNFVPYFYYFKVPTGMKEREGYLFLQRNGRSGIHTTLDKRLSTYIKENFTNQGLKLYHFLYDDALDRFKNKFVKSFVFSTNKKHNDKTDDVEKGTIYDKLKIEVHLDTDVSHSTGWGVKSLFKKVKEEDQIKQLLANDDFIDVVAVLGESGHNDKRVKESDGWSKLKPDSDIDEDVAKKDGHPIFKSIKKITDDLLDDIMDS